jgi:uncharacterized SAM-binding protein YcdF (DUF218 family)
MSWLVTTLIAAVFLPPLNLILLGGAGLLLWRRRPAAARWLLTLSFTLLWLLSTPYVSNGLMGALEGPLHPPDPRKQPPDAIIVLGAGTYFDAPEYGGDTVSQEGLVRLRYAAKLQRETGKPVMATGGTPEGNALSEAQQMKEVLEHEFKVPVQWTEDQSRNTAENAVFCYRKLSPLGIRRIYLVTHAWHMRRAALAFRQAGFDVIPAPTEYTTARKTDLTDFVPSIGALESSRWFLHELLGLLWYFLKS